MNRRGLALGTAVVLSAAIVIFVVEKWTRPTRAAVRTFVTLIDSARLGDIDTARSLCSSRYLSTHSLQKAKGGGIEGVPLNIHKNFQVWRDGSTILLCPGNRIGPVYRFIDEADHWKFDGPIGLLRGGGHVELLSETSTETP